MADGPETTEVVMVGSEDEGREAQGHDAQGRSKVPRLESGVDRTTGSEGARDSGATSSGGAQSALALATNGSPGEGVLGLPGGSRFTWNASTTALWGICKWCAQFGG